jgi:hypothetical protein
MCHFMQGRFPNLARPQEVPRVCGTNISFSFVPVFKVVQGRVYQLVVGGMSVA